MHTNINGLDLIVVRLNDRGENCLLKNISKKNLHFVKLVSKGVFKVQEKDTLKRSRRYYHRHNILHITDNNCMYNLITSNTNNIRHRNMELLEQRTSSDCRGSKQ